MGSAPQDKETPEGDEKNRETALGHILLNGTGKEYASSILGRNQSTTYQFLECWAEPVVIFLSWVEPVPCIWAELVNK